MKKRLLTQAAFAKKIGVSAPRVNHLVSAGIIKLVNGKVDPEQALKAIATSSHPSYEKKLPGRPVNGNGGTSAQSGRYWAQTDLALAKAKLAWLEYQRRNGELIPIVGARDEWARVIMLMVSRMESFPSKLAPLLFDCESIAEIAAILTEHLDQLRREMCDPGQYRRTGVFAKR